MPYTGGMANQKISRRLTREYSGHPVKMLAAEHTGRDPRQHH
jgi:hypothetical protein